MIRIVRCGRGDACIGVLAQGLYRTGMQLHTRMRLFIQREPLPYMGKSYPMSCRQKNVNEQGRQEAKLEEETCGEAKQRMLIRYAYTCRQNQYVKGGGPEAASISLMPDPRVFPVSPDTSVVDEAKHA